MNGTIKPLKNKQRIPLVNADVPERSIDPVTNFSLFLHVYFSYAPVIFSNQTDPTGKLMKLVIKHLWFIKPRYSHVLN
jgi:hypothetical protein